MSRSPHKDVPTQSHIGSGSFRLTLQYQTQIKHEVSRASAYTATKAREEMMTTMKMQHKAI